MGDMADFVLDEVMEFEERRLDYRSGRMDDVEAYDLGITDEMGYELVPQMQNLKAGSLDNAYKVCRCCGEGGLHWGLHGGKWRLFDSDGVHACQKNPLRKEA